MSAFTPPGPLRIPVLIAAFTRYDTTRQVFEAVRAARPPRLYFACDGGRNEAEWEKCRRVRSLVELVDWPCEVRTLFHERNMGSKYGMAANFDWFFAHEPEGVILEDDIVPATSFFWFAQELLERYRHDERVWAIIGNNLMTDGKVVDPDGYWFNGHGYGAYWGWASWRRSWARFDIDMKRWPEARDKDLFKDFFLSRAERREAHMLFESTWDRSLPSAWDYQFEFARMLAGAVNIIPNVNLCRNIGFGDGSTHTVNESDPRNQEHLHEAVFPLRHPAEVAIDPARDLAYFDRFLRTPTRVLLKGWIKGLLPARARSFISGLKRGHAGH
ncbi:MAG: nucleotide-diphospho-sugar transferase [Flavobacteriales bacterium]|nr:nucleotide-diphospho-sugar transferase [Flavobacteriales bacterium]